MNIKWKLILSLAGVVVVLAGICLLLRLKQDRTPPQIVVESQSDIYNQEMSNGELLDDVYAEDDRDGDVSDSLRIEKIYSDENGNVCVVYVAKDSSNNVSKLNRILHME